MTCQRGDIRSGLRSRMSSNGSGTRIRRDSACPSGYDGLATMLTADSLPRRTVEWTREGLVGGWNDKVNHRRLGETLSQECLPKGGWGTLQRSVTWPLIPKPKAHPPESVPTGSSAESFAISVTRSSECQASHDRLGAIYAGHVVGYQQVRWRGEVAQKVDG